MKNVFWQGVSAPSFGKLPKNASTDVLIVGGGIAGVLCAYKLCLAGVRCMLIEAEEILSGITKNTTAKITLAHGFIYDKLIGSFGIERARLYAEAQAGACLEYAELCRGISCDYETGDSCVYTLREREIAENELTALRALGIEAELSFAEELPFSVSGAVRVKNQAHINPIKFLSRIAKDLPIYEHTRLLDLKPERAITTSGEIKYERAVIATHFPIINKHGSYFLKLYQHRSYVIALRGAGKLSGMYVDEAKGGFSFRSYGDILLLGGGAHRTGKRGSGWRELEEFAAQHYGGAKTVGRWATQDCMTLDGIPYIGKYSLATDNLYVATGFNKWGMTNSLVAANILTDLLTGKPNPSARLFSPSRSMLRPQLAANIFESAKGLLTPTAPRCPHLGCALKYNPHEHSWDCPCHGSRFTERGELIDDPANVDKTIDKYI